MKSDEAEVRFFNSQLVTGVQGRDERLSDSTAGCLARSMIEMLKTAHDENNKDSAVKQAAGDAISSMRAIELNSTKQARKKLTLCHSPNCENLLRAKHTQI